jgi:hypothetical protein
VEHDIDGFEEDTTVWQFVLSDERIQASEAEMIEARVSAGFSDKRQARTMACFPVVIVDSISKLVDSPITVRPFAPKLLPDPIKVDTSISDPEARGSVVGEAIATLRQVGKVPTSDGSDLSPFKHADAGSLGSDLPPFKHANAGSLGSSLVSIYKKLGANPVPSVANVKAVYVTHLTANLVNAKNFDMAQWVTLASHLALLSSTDLAQVAAEWAVRFASDDDGDEETLEDEEDGEDLRNCQFSLAYGAKILLSTATLRLKHSCHCLPPSLPAALVAYHPRRVPPSSHAALVAYRVPPRRLPPLSLVVYCPRHVPPSSSTALVACHPCCMAPLLHAALIACGPRCLPPSLPAAPVVYRPRRVPPSSHATLVAYRDQCLMRS